MGYTTRFSGQFDLDAELTIGQYNYLRKMADMGPKERKDGMPDAWCQWEPTEDGLHIQWNGGEKFYDYEEWLQYICDALLPTWGRVLNGEVNWAGEEADDVGVLRVVYNKVSAHKMVPAGTKVQCPECDHEFYAETKP